MSKRLEDEINFYEKQRALFLSHTTLKRYDMKFAESNARENVMIAKAISEKSKTIAKLIEKFADNQRFTGHDVHINVLAVEKTSHERLQKVLDAFKSKMAVLKKKLVAAEKKEAKAKKSQLKDTKG